MSTIALRRIRIWLLLLTTLCVILVIAQYAYAAVRLGTLLKLVWQDWGAIISIVILFFSYIYTLKGQPHPRLHKYLCAFLIFIPTIMILYINFDYLARYLKSTSLQPERRFVCPASNANCLLHWSMLFVSIIMAAFVLIEVGMTLAWGPLEKVHQYGVAHGYAQNANVVIVSPDQPQQQLHYPQQQQGYYPQHQQAPIPMQCQQQQLYQYQQPVALDPNPPYQQQATQFYKQQAPPPLLPQQQQYQYPAVLVTSSVPGAVAYPQSPIATSRGYQQQPLPPVLPVSSNSQYVPITASQ
ncbi:hypothetical protein BGZ95_004837 [Linnemannia exigua]|uniref:Uncharacterized protein n=1 Tax=Linnemannia exigua TaxID=604196 RepID=A0AAD4DH29_9FUNG|nr:hypothetical protein BGZ95_004837 [Linnemannia exigua]